MNAFHAFAIAILIKIERLFARWVIKINKYVSDTLRRIENDLKLKR